jgi:hypothetical protein
VKNGKLKLTVRCSRASLVKLTGTIKSQGKKKNGKLPEPKTFKLGPVNGYALGTAPVTLKVTVPSKAVKALKSGAKQSASFKLAAGTAIVATAKIAKLKKP